jgi:hypothetical protein
LIALAPFLDSSDLSKLVRDRLSGPGRIDEGMLIGLAPFLDKGTLSEILHKSVLGGPPTPPQAPQAQSAPQPPQREIVTHGTNLPEVAPNEELARLAARLAHPDISSEERSEIAVRLSELALHQGQMARE